MAERGETSARAAEVAALDTRRAKDYGVSVERLRGRVGAPGRPSSASGRREIEGLPRPRQEREPEPPEVERACSTSWRARRG